MCQGNCIIYLFIAVEELLEDVDVASPLKKMIAGFLQDYDKSRHMNFDPVNLGGELVFFLAKQMESMESSEVLKLSQVIHAKYIYWKAMKV